MHHSLLTPWDSVALGSSCIMIIMFYCKSKDTFYLQYLLQPHGLLFRRNASMNNMLPITLSFRQFWLSAA